ncbi:exodeoxyribonuclease I [Blochmannia endosymbiont of Colobopsis nipponica]|uniref:exodeoxyribonuclease I n=1 Tax=Blochmannia endosymbiont of Colobopsis nipponica TaxID=2681987 RepID=UPI001784CA73|nr:exodeoxyribonuclease I [Blochmannia endosymbiont of Colobopsis nipponica]QOI11000.1 exodeoxyribonuclease I [Blochmannia endosymbiont of Colobopsis nipponica]
MNKFFKQKNFFIYDYETFGKNPALDKPVQFAGIRTNKDLIPTEKPITFFCRPSDDYLPEPEAVLIHGITPQQALKKGITEAKFAKYIHQIFSKSNTCIFGYNNIKFDDEVSRNIFYRNFFDPYSWSWKCGNSRWDLLNVMHACYTLRPEGINWPINKKGIPSFKLKDLTKHNDINHTNNHDAIHDVNATLELAKLVLKMQPKLFNYLHKYHTKQQIRKLIKKTKMKPLIYVSNKFYNANKKNITCVAPIMWHPNNPNILITCDINNNIETILDNDINTLKEQLFLTEKNLEKNNESINLVHINRCPILAPINTLRPQDINRLELDINTQYSKLIYLKKNRKNINKKITSIYSDIKYHTPSYSSKHVDTKLYNNFFTTPDLKAMNKIRCSSPEILPKLKIDFIDERLKPLLFYYRARNFPNTLNDYEQKYWGEYIKKTFNKSYLSHYDYKLKLLISIHKKNKTKTQLLYSLLKHLENFTKLTTNKKYSNIID